MNDVLPRCFFAVVLQWCFTTGVNVWWVCLAPQNIPSAIVLTVAYKVVLLSSTIAVWAAADTAFHPFHALLPCILQALVYDILTSTTSVFSYAIGSRKLSANEQFFVGAETVVSLLQTTQIKQGVSFIAANRVYTSTNKTTIVWIETEFFFNFLSGVDASHVYVRALVLGCFYSHISTRTFRRALTASLDSCAEIKSTPSVA